ncbi:thioredoxin domain-containing protein [Zunongwangia sp. H14]|uniref:thioredoxin domain-containing protein n=1 Tax=Zunongwangia sp. H14 TaxID=3240792 RepID=UPI0035669A84
MNLQFSKLLSLSVFLCLCLGSCGKGKKADEEPISNRLAKASSPYLIEHADNPVDWYEWGPEALEKAKNEDKPIIISIGYAACHWCHVMEEESFMDSTVAAIMNQNFVSIKIDREERPDIDKIYMNAAQLLNGSGGWPLNAVALPNGKPFFAGTYFPPDEWKNLLTQISEAYKIDRENLTKTANALTEGIRNNNGIVNPEINKSGFSKEAYIGVLENWEKTWDTEKGGYKGSQKFPLPSAWESLLQYHYLTQDPKALEMVETSLQHMARGGIYDQLGGGFSRYTTDPDWLYPHFEKMLYDNAQLISLYSKAFKVTGNTEFKKVAEESIDFVEKELANGEGGFYASLNADSEGEEGKFYVWTADEIKNTLTSAEADLFLKYFNIENYGNWEKGKNVLYCKYSEEEFAVENNMNPDEVKRIITKAKDKLLNKRNHRTKPSIDHKSLTSWNALMLEAYLDAYTAWGNRIYLEKAIKTAEFLNASMMKQKQGLWRSYKDNQPKIEAFLDDYAFLSKAYLHLYQVNFELKWLEKARSLTDYSIAHFRDPETGMFFYTEITNNELVARNMETEDMVMPSSNAITAYNLFTLGTLFENQEYLAISDKMLTRMFGQAIEQPAYYSKWVSLVGIETFGAYEIAIMGDEAAQKNLLLQHNYLPTSVFMGGNKENLPLLEAKLAPDKTLIYVCQNRTCKYPVEGIDEALVILKNSRKK